MTSRFFIKNQNYDIMQNYALGPRKLDGLDSAAGCRGKDSYSGLKQSKECGLGKQLF